MDQSSKPRPGEDNDDDNDDEEDHKARPEELLEDSWFFRNSFNRKLTISTDSNDPFTMNSTKSYDDTYQSIKKVSQRDESGPSTCLMRRPSLPLCPGKEGSNILMPKGGSEVERRKSESGNMSSEEFARAPTTGDEEIQDEEVEFSMGKLIRQASLKSSDHFMIPANHSPNKGMTATNSCTSPRKMEFSKLKLERLRPRRQMNQLKSQKSLSDLQSKELQGFKDLGFDSGEKNLKVQELKRIEEDGGRNTRQFPYPSEVQNSAPESKWDVVKRSREDDMKAQIKFWARAVASNMRQD